LILSNPLALWERVRGREVRDSTTLTFILSLLWRARKPDLGMIEPVERFERLEQLKRFKSFKLFKTFKA
jgi:hypothetical protein